MRNRIGQRAIPLHAAMSSRLHEALLLLFRNRPELAPELLPGLKENAHNLCDPDSVMQLKDVVSSVEEGTMLIVIASVPFKCPPSPYEYAFLIEDMLQKRGVREAVRIVVTTPEPQPMPVAGKEVGAKMVALLRERGIEFFPEQKPKMVDASPHSVLYENGMEVLYDVLAAMPPHHAPKVVRDAGLTNEAGFIPVDLGTLRASLPNIYAVGDSASLTLPNGKPHPKAGFFAEAQARTVSRNIIARLEGKREESYTGIGVCYVDTGRGQAAAAEAYLLAEGGPRFIFREPSREGLEAKAQFEHAHLMRWFGG